MAQKQAEDKSAAELAQRELEAKRKAEEEVKKQQAQENARREFEDSAASDTVQRIAERNAVIAAAIQDSSNSRLDEPLSSRVFALLKLDFIRGAKFLGWEDIPQRKEVSQMTPAHRFQLAKLLKERLRTIVDVLNLGEHDRKIFVTPSAWATSIANASPPKTQIDIKHNIENAIAAAEN